MRDQLQRILRQRIGLPTDRVVIIGTIAPQGAATLVLPGTLAVTGLGSSLTLNPGTLLPALGGLVVGDSGVAVVGGSASSSYFSNNFTSGSLSVVAGTLDLTGGVAAQKGTLNVAAGATLRSTMENFAGRMAPVVFPLTTLEDTHAALEEAAERVLEEISDAMKRRTQQQAEA